ncbi:MAG: hypothetical protein AB7N99_08710 [Simkaniaceae bacterium]
MSSVINNKNDNDQALVQPKAGEKVQSQDVTSLSVMILTASQMVESLGSHIGDPSNQETNNFFTSDDLMTEMMLQDEKKRLQKGEKMEEALIRAIGSDLVDPKKDKTDGKTPNAKQALGSKGASGASSSGKYTGNNAIFQAAGLVDQLHQNSQESMIQQMQDQLKIMQTELETLEKLEDFIVELEKDLKAWQADPTNETKFDTLINLLKDHFKGSPDILQLLDSLNLSEAEKEQQDWDSKSGFTKGWDDFWGVDQDERYAMRNFEDFANNIFSICERTAFGNQPELYASFMTEGQKAFEARIQKIVTQMSMLLMILSILEGGSAGMEAVFKAQALLLSLMNTAVQNNADKSSQQTEMAKINEQIQQHNYEKAQDQLKKIEKSEHHHHGLFGWLEDAFDAIKNFFVDLFSGKMSFTDIFKKLGDMLESMLGIRGLIVMIEDLCKGKSFLDSLEDALTQQLLGVMGPIFQGSEFENDIKNAVKLVVDAVVALTAITLYAMGGCEDKSLLDAAKSHGEAILENPALQAVADIAMVVIIIASVVSQQYWLAAIMVVLLVMNDVTDSKGNSLMTDFTTKVIEPIFKAMGASDEVAKILADVTVIVITLVATMGVGGFSAVAEEGAEEVVSEVASEAQSMGERIVEALKNFGQKALDFIKAALQKLYQAIKQVPDDLQNAYEGAVQKLQDAYAYFADDTTTAMDKARGVLNGIKDAVKSIPEAVGSRGGLALMETGMMMGATNFASDFAKAVAKDDKKLQEILTILLEVVEVLMSVVGGAGMAAGDGISAIDQSIGNTLKKLAPDLATYMEENSASMLNAARQLQVGGQVAGGLSNIGMAGDNILVGVFQAELKKIEGQIAVMNTAQAINDTQMKSNEAELKKLTKEQIQFVNEMNAPSLASMGDARALEQLA